ncbi:SAM-dependent methyltransferase [Frankia sp. EAN1pec]
MPARPQTGPRASRTGATQIAATVRTRSEVERFFAGLDVVEPGAPSVHR